MGILCCGCGFGMFELVFVAGAPIFGVALLSVLCRAMMPSPSSWWTKVVVGIAAISAVTLLPAALPWSLLIAPIVLLLLLAAVLVNVPGLFSMQYSLSDLLAGIFAFALLPPILGAFGLSTSTALQISFFLIPPLVLAAMLRMHRRKLPQSMPRSLYIFIYPYSLLGAAMLGMYFFLHAIPGGGAGSQEPAVLLTAALFAVAGRMVLTNVLQHQRQDELADLRPPRIL